MQELINTEKKTRTETEETVVEVLKEMVNKVEKDLEEEKTNRNQNEESLLMLLESTIAKLNKSMSYQL